MGKRAEMEETQRIQQEIADRIRKKQRRKRKRNKEKGRELNMMSEPKEICKRKKKKWLLKNWRQKKNETELHRKRNGRGNENSWRVGLLKSTGKMLRTN